jgi:hypothetical protein
MPGKHSSTCSISSGLLRIIQHGIFLLNGAEDDVRWKWIVNSVHSRKLD